MNEEDLARSTSSLLADLMRDLPGIQVSDSGQPGLSQHVTADRLDHLLSGELPLHRAALQVFW